MFFWLLTRMMLSCWKMTDALTKRYSMNILLYHFVIRPVSRRYQRRRRHWRNWKICLSIWWSVCRVREIMTVLISGGISKRNMNIFLSLSWPLSVMVSQSGLSTKIWVHLNTCSAGWAIRTCWFLLSNWWRIRWTSNTMCRKWVCRWFF